MSLKSLKLRELSTQLALWMALGCLVAPIAAALADDAVVPAAVAPDYRIGPGDTLKVSVFQNDELTATLPVRPDGKISTPLVEDMVAVGKTPSQLARDIEASHVGVHQSAQGQRGGDRRA